MVKYKVTHDMIGENVSKFYENLEKQLGVTARKQYPAEYLQKLSENKEQLAKLHASTVLLGLPNGQVITKLQAISKKMPEDVMKTLPCLFGGFQIEKGFYPYGNGFKFMQMGRAKLEMYSLTQQNLKKVNSNTKKASTPSNKALGGGDAETLKNLIDELNVRALGVHTHRVFYHDYVAKIRAQESYDSNRNAWEVNRENLAQKLTDEEKELQEVVVKVKELAGKTPGVIDPDTVPDVNEFDSSLFKEDDILYEPTGVIKSPYVPVIPKGLKGEAKKDYVDNYWSTSQTPRPNEPVNRQGVADASNYAYILEMIDKGENLKHWVLKAPTLYLKEVALRKLGRLYSADAADYIDTFEGLGGSSNKTDYFQYIPVAEGVTLHSASNYNVKQDTWVLFNINDYPDILNTCRNGLYIIDEDAGIYAFRKSGNSTFCIEDCVMVPEARPSEYSSIYTKEEWIAKYGDAKYIEPLTDYVVGQCINASMRVVSGYRPDLNVYIYATAFDTAGRWDNDGDEYYAEYTYNDWDWLPECSAVGRRLYR